MSSSPVSIPEASASDLTTPVFADILAAAERLKGKAILTPLLENQALNERTGGRILIKPEVLQRTGSFKFRGAYNAISSLPDDARTRGVIAYSSGNHAQGVAAAAQICGVPARIVMPSDAPAIKVQNTKGYGAEVIPYDRFGENREAIAARICAEHGSYLIAPYDDRRIIAGQGTCGLEIAEQSQALGALPEEVLTCCGGGGLTAGIALALENKLPETALTLVEPAGFDDTGRSLGSGAREANDPTARSICDALLSPMPGNLTFQINKKLVAQGVAVSDSEVMEAMAFAFRWLKLVVEPGGAVTLAAILSGKVKTQGRTLAIVLSGGNVDWARLQEALERT